MPHKHRLSTNSKSASNYDLPPISHARPLPVDKLRSKSQSTSTKAAKPKSCASNAGSFALKPLSSKIRKFGRKETPKDDDTPRAFSRLISNYHPPPRSGLDDGRLAAISSKKRKRDADGVPAPTATHPAIQRGESLSTYGARVDASLPVAGLEKRGSRGNVDNLKGIKGLGTRQTKANKKLQKMQKQWREEDARRKARLEEVKEEEELDFNTDDEIEGKESRKRLRKKEEDPWAAVAAKRLEATDQGGGLVGLHDVVLAPPKLARATNKTFKIPNKQSAVGLKRMAELHDARSKVVEGYRTMMKQKIIS